MPLPRSGGEDAGSDEIRASGGDTATPLNLAKRLRLLERHAGPLAGKRVIDCGCGAGEYVRRLASAGGRAFGIEFQEDKLAEALARGRRLPLARADIEQLPFGDGQFDLALVNEVLEHVPNDARGLEEVHRVLRPGGVVAVFSPNRLYPFETHGVFLKGSRRRVPHYVPAIPYLPVRLGRLWLHYWARNYWPWELRRLVARAGFQVLGQGYVWQTFENISGHQPRPIARLRPLLRAIADRLEAIPLVRAFGVSQLVLARRPPV